MSKIQDIIAKHSKLMSIVGAGFFAISAWVFPSQYSYFMVTAAVIAGIPVLNLAWQGLMARQFTIPLLVSIAAVGAIWIDEPWEAAAVTFLYMLGSYLEDITLARTRAALRTLVDMRPRTARIKDGEEIQVVSAETVEAGQIVVVLPGDKVPVDGEVLAGQAALDTAALTGEPLPAEVGIGDQVLSGSVSTAGYLEVRATRVGADTTFSRLIYLVAEAQEQKPRAQKFLDRFAQWYTPAVIISAIGIYVFARDIELALTFLVIGCPGALVVAAPVATVAGLGNAAKRGILIKGGERLEKIGQVDTIAFDKTGTLTQGKPRVTEVVPFDGSSERLVSLAAAAEQRSEHHLAVAILSYAEEMGISAVPAREWHLEPGLGAVVETEEGLVLVGNRRLLSSRGVELSLEQERILIEREQMGATIALVAVDANPLGLLAISDLIRTEAFALAEAMRQAGVRHTVMLTGDHLAAAQRVASQLHIDEVQAGLKPEDKVAAIRRLQTQGRTVAMVGDGINDAPALATADVAIAMGGSGTQAAIEAADITLMSDHVHKVVEAIGLSKRIMKVVRQNVAFAVLVVLLLLVGVMSRRVFLASGMLVHEASILVVILNGMRLLRSDRAQG
ncbi:MAG: heavy metal translocating P-type ATPase [Limnochordia bacterium]|jgi:Cd2+/Zn2+-exporting ATPase